MALDGTWNVTMVTPMGERSGTLELATDGDTLSGKWTGPQGTQAFDKGSVDGASFSWTSEVSGPAGAMEIQWEGQEDGDAIAGTLQFGNFGGGDFRGTRA